MNRFQILFNVIIVTSVIGLALSYFTSLFPNILPRLSFLEAVGVYCFWVPIHQTITGALDNKKE
jgi:hypothetical protein